MLIEVTESEFEDILAGLVDTISEMCCSAGERKPLEDLIDKLKKQQRVERFPATSGS